MADIKASRVTDSTKIVKTQIQQKDSDSTVVGIHPETDTSIVLNGSGLTGDTVQDVLDNALTLKGSGAVDITASGSDVTISVDGNKILPTGGTNGQLLASDGAGSSKWITPIIGRENGDVITFNPDVSNDGPQGIYAYNKNAIDTKIKALQDSIAAIDQFKYVVSTDAATTPSGVTWKEGSTTITGTLAASAATEFIIYLVPDSSDVESGAYLEYMTVKVGSTYSWEPIGTTRISIASYTLVKGATDNIIKLQKDGADVSSVTVNNVANATTATKLGSTTVGGTITPIYLKDGIATACSQYAGGTNVSLNGSNKSGQSASVYAPTTAATVANQLIIANSSKLPTWATFANAGLLKVGTNGAVTVDTNSYAVKANITAGVYSAVQVNTSGIVTAGAQVIKMYEAGDTIGAELVQNGFAFVKIA